MEEIETNYNLFDPVEGGFHRYGTQKDWSPPHYEKMLYDNARLLKSYIHLLQLDADNKIAQEVVAKTLSFIDQNWYDPEGGFYGNSDVHGEDAYYGEVDRRSPKPRVEKTKYSDWNAEAITTYLFLWQTTQDNKYKTMAETTLDFFADEMVTSTGAFHYQKEDKTKGVRGSLLDNAYLLLAFVEGYEVLQKQSYLETAERIADYSLENLYDWNSGGFFERNSPDIELYAPGEYVNLEKPNAENGIITYALAKLYTFTNNPLYLNAAVKTFGNRLNNIGGLDSGYYFTKAAQYMLQNNLLQEYNTIDIADIEKQKQEAFWVDELLEGKFKVSEVGLQKIQGSIILLMIIALIAGIVSFASPCTLPILPAYVAYILKSKNNFKGMTLSFFLGLSIIFSLLGMTATTVGNFLKSSSSIFSQIAGIGIIIFGIFILLGKGIPGLHLKPNKPTSYFGAFIFGSILGISWSACVGPILLGILLLASTASSVFTGGLLLFIYAIGIGLPLVLTSIYLEKINQKGKIWTFIKGKEITFKIRKKKYTMHTSALISGILFIILGILIFSGTLYTFNQYVTTTSFQEYIFAIEEWLLNLVR